MCVGSSDWYQSNKKNNTRSIIQKLHANRFTESVLKLILKSASYKINHLTKITSAQIVKNWESDKGVTNDRRSNHVSYLQCIKNETGVVHV